jgi:hypothetical protein
MESNPDSSWLCLDFRKGRVALMEERQSADPHPHAALRPGTAITVYAFGAGLMLLPPVYAAIGVVLAFCAIPWTAFIYYRELRLLQSILTGRIREPLPRDFWVGLYAVILESCVLVYLIMAQLGSSEGTTLVAAMTSTRFINWSLWTVALVIGTFTMLSALTADAPSVVRVIGGLMVGGMIFVGLPELLRATTFAIAPLTAVAPAGPLTLRELFKTDFDFQHYDMEAYTSVTLKGDDGSSTTISVTIFQDYHSRSFFLSFYLPENPHTYDACEVIALREYKNVIARFMANGSIQVPEPGGLSQTTKNELKFSGRIYVYYESFLSLSQLGALEHTYENAGLSFIPRGPGYLDIERAARAPRTKR